MNEYQIVDIGTSIKYFDYLGLERFGTIGFIEPGKPDESGEPTVYVYIEDEETEYNDKPFIRPDGTTLMYAEIRISTEVYIDERKTNVVCRKKS